MSPICSFYKDHSDNYCRDDSMRTRIDLFSVFLSIIQKVQIDYDSFINDLPKVGDGLTVVLELLSGKTTEASIQSLEKLNWKIMRQNSGNFHVIYRAQSSPKVYRRE